MEARELSRGEKGRYGYGLQIGDCQEESDSPRLPSNPNGLFRIPYFWTGSSVGIEETILAADQSDD